MKEIFDYIKSFGLLLLITLALLACVFYSGYRTGYNKKIDTIKPDNPTTPVEKNDVDTVYIIRDSLIYKDKYIIQTKHDTIEKVYNLNDSATLELFYKLVSE